MAIDVCTVDDQLQNEAGRIGEMLNAKMLARSPWVRLFEQEAFPEAMGQTINTLFYERTKIPDVSNAAWTNVGLNDGSANTCTPTPQQMEYARTLKSYNLQQAFVKSPTLCVNDIRYGWEFSQQLAEQYRILEMNTKWFWENRFRDEFLRLAGNHVVVDSVNPRSMSSSGSGQDFPASRAVFALEQGMLDYWYMKLVRDSAEGAYGTIDGQDQFLLIASPEQINNLKKQNQDIRQDQRFSSTANELLAPLGATWAYMGFYYLADIEAPRYNFVNGQYVRVPYYIDVPASTGNKAIVNPAYENAAFEVSFIFNSKAMKSRVASQITNPGGQVKFDAVNYRGDFIWTNIKDNICNPLGNNGYFLALFMQGTEPLRTEWAYAILHQNCGTPTVGYSCS